MKRLQLALFPDGSDMPLFLGPVGFVVTDDEADAAQLGIDAEAAMPPADPPDPDPNGGGPHDDRPGKGSDKPHPNVWEVVGWVSTPVGLRWRIMNTETGDYREWDEGLTALMQRYDDLSRLATRVAAFFGPRMLDYYESGDLSETDLIRELNDLATGRRTSA